MQSSQTHYDNCRRRTHLPLLFFAVAGILMLTNFASRGRGAPDKVNLSARGGRPVAEAIRMLEANCHCVITYEDPRYVHDSEIADVTEKVRNAPRVLVPKGGALTLDYDSVPGTRVPINTSIVVQEIVNANSASGNAGRFRVERSGQFIHVVPTATKNNAGVLAPQESVLDAVISLPGDHRSGMQTLRAICAAVSQETKMHVVVGTVPWNRFNQHRDGHRATNQKARDVLVQFLERTGSTDLSWQLFYGPGMKWYVLNIHGVH